MHAATSVDLQTGALLLITGRGRHTGGRSKLRDAVEDALRARAARGELGVHPRGPGRLEVVLSEERARAARGGLGALFWLIVALAGAGVAAALWRALS